MMPYQTGFVEQILLTIIEEVFELSVISLEVLDFSTICRKRKTIKCVLGSVKSSGELYFSFIRVSN